MRFTRSLKILLLVASLITAQGAPASGMQADPTERLRAAVAAHPDDPDLVWAYARSLASDRQAEAAIEVTNAFLARWPDRRPDARIAIARTLIAVGETAAALRLLDREVVEQPDSATARFYRGIALRQSGQVILANREFQSAGSLQPSFRPETLLARALGLLELGREEEAIDLLKRLLQLDPSGDSAVRARLLLRQRELLDLERSWRLDAYAGVEYDTNVTLESSSAEVAASGSDDVRGLWGLGATWRAWSSEQASLIAGFRHDQTEHHDLNAFNLISDALFLSTTYRASERVAVRFDGLAYNTLQDLDAEMTGGLLRPNLLYSLGPKWGALRAYAQVELSEYHETAFFAPFERDAVAYSVGVEHFRPLFSKKSWLALSIGWTRTLTQAESSGGSDGFDGDFDYDSVRVRGIANLELPLTLRGRIEVSYNHDDYHNDNLSHAIATLGGIRKRRDHNVSGRIGLIVPIRDHVAAEIYWRGSRRYSNLALFDYDKHLVGALLRFTTD